MRAMAKGFIAPRPGIPAPGILGSAGSSYAALATAALLWSGNFIVGGLLRDDVTPVTLNFLRWLIAFAILLALGYRDLWRARQALQREWKLIAAAGLTGIAAFHTCVYFALRDTVALNALLLLSIAPIAIMLLSRLTGAAFSARNKLGAVVSLGGAALLIMRGDPAALLDLQGKPGDLWMLAAVAIWATYSVLLQRRPPALTPSTMLTSSIAAGLVWLAPLYAFEILRGSAGFDPTVPATLGLAYVAIGASVFAFLLWCRGVAALGPSRAGQFLHLMPLFGAILSVLLLGEEIAPYHLVGAGLVFAGIAFTQNAQDAAWRR